MLRAGRQQEHNVRVSKAASDKTAPELRRLLLHELLAWQPVAEVLIGRETSGQEPLQRELAEVVDITEVLNLHRQPPVATGRRHSGVSPFSGCYLGCTCILEFGGRRQ
jgi:hypothetical protein